MLLLKLLLHWNAYIQKIKVENLKVNFNYFLLNWKFYFYFINLLIFKFFFKKKVTVNYLFNLYVKTQNLNIFNSTVIIFFNFFKNVYVLNPEMYVKNVSIRKKHYTVLRSPFVHKTSREQFVFEQIKGVIRISFKKANIFFINYLKYLIKFFFY